MPKGWDFSLRSWSTSSFGTQHPEIRKEARRNQRLLWRIIRTFVLFNYSKQIIKNMFVLEAIISG